MNLHLTLKTVWPRMAFEVMEATAKVIAGRAVEVGS